MRVLPIDGRHDKDRGLLGHEEELSCQHLRRVPYHGTIKCTSCGYVYDESACEWREDE